MISSCLVLLVGVALMSVLHLVMDVPVFGLDLMAVLVIVTFTCAYINDLKKNIFVQTVFSGFVLGYLFRIFLLFWDIYCSDVFLLPNSGSDSRGFYSGALSYAAGGEPWGYFSEVMGTLFIFTGPSRIFAQFLIALCSIVSIHMANRCMCLLNVDSNVRRRSMTILALLPCFAILSSIFLRESIVAMFVTVSLFFFVKWMKTASNPYYLLAFIFVFFGARFHSGVVGVAGGYIAVLLFYNIRNNTLNLSLKRMAVAALFLGAFVFLFNHYSETFFGKMQNVEEICDIANKNTAGGSSYAAYVGNSNSPIDIVVYTPLRIAFFLFSPFPWQWRGLADVIAFCFSSCFYIFSVAAGIGAVRKGHPNSTVIKLLFVVAASTVFIFGWGVSNTGTAARHRDKMVCLYGLIYALSKSRTPAMISHVDLRKSYA